MGGVWGRNVDSSTAPGQKFLPFLVSPRFVKKSLGDPFHPLESSRWVESWCPGNKFRFLNLKPGDSASAKSIEKTIYFERSWRPGRNGDSAALSANRKTHLAQRRAILTNVFINVRSLQGDFFLEPSELNYPKALCRAAWIRRREAVSQKRQPWTETVEEFGARLRDTCDHINTHFDAEGLCKGLPSRAQNLGSNPEGSALFPLGMQILLHMSLGLV